ncbi:MAG: hypothetical protein L6R42_008990 [Xanthoria sp. 1 TBL-2021]|nr:MAG: hypothetical protein L6R42_008990 [Xanthoria sp. 1 TBL-2021]
MSNLAANLTALQLHVAFWDYNNDSIITPVEIYRGFRDLGFCIPFSLGGLLINLFFSYPTTLGHSWLPDPLFRIYTDTIHKAKHGSDTGVYSSEGNLRLVLFDEVFDKMDSSGTKNVSEANKNSPLGTKGQEGSLGVGDLFRLHAKNRVAADPAGWSFAAMEWWTTWLLLQRDGRLWKEDLRAMYDGTLFWKIREERAKNGNLAQGYGWQDWLGSLWNNGTWKTWEVKHKDTFKIEVEREL